jgi:hypothetical protein
MRQPNPSIREIAAERHAIERKALAAAAKDPTIRGAVRRHYEELRKKARESRGDPYLTGGADAVEELLGRMELAKDLTA